MPFSAVPFPGHLTERRQLPPNPVCRLFIRWTGRGVPTVAIWVLSVKGLRFRVLECRSSRLDWVPPPPPPQASVARLQDPSGGGGGGGTQFRRLDRNYGSLHSIIPLRLRLKNQLNIATLEAKISSSLRALLYKKNVKKQKQNIKRGAIFFFLLFLLMVDSARLAEWDGQDQQFAVSGLSFLSLGLTPPDSSPPHSCPAPPPRLTLPSLSSTERTLQCQCQKRINPTKKSRS